MSTVKERTRSTFIQVAKEVFMQKGIADAFMEEIAVKAGKTRRTIYRYFDTKEDLAYVVLIEILGEWNSFLRTSYNKLNGTGIERIEAYLKQMVQYMQERMDLMAFLAEFDFYFQDSHEKQVDESVLVAFDQASLESDGLIEKLVELGIKDGSIRLRKEKHLVVSTISSVLWGFGQRIAIRGKAITMELHIEPLEIINCQIDIYVDYLKGV